MVQQDESVRTTHQEKTMNELEAAARKVVATFDRWLWAGMDEVELVKAVEELRAALNKQKEEKT